jgi:hypothetical protein
VSLVKPTVYRGSRGVQQNLFCNFWTFIQVFTNFGSLKQFLELKTFENELKFTAQCRTETGLWLQCVAWRPATHGRLGHGLAARWRLADDKVLGSSTTTTRQMHRARRVEAGLLEEVRRRWGRAAASSSEGGSAVTPASSGSCRGG